VSSASVKQLDPTLVELEIEISEAELDAARERAFRELVKNVRIPGFRPGKAPRKVFEAQYGTDGIAERAMDRVVRDAYPRALKENALEPVDEPQMELLPEEEGRPLRLRATVSVRPPIELAEYKGLAVDAQPATVTDEDLERSLEALRREAATLVPVDRPVEAGDVPTLDYEGRIDGVPFDGGKAENQPVELIADRFIPGFVAGIVGMQAGEERQVEAAFPEDYSNAALAGKKPVFSVKVHENKKAEIPALDDAFAQRFGGEKATLEALRSDMRRRLELQAFNHAQRRRTSQLVDQLLSAHDFALPVVMVERETEHLWNEERGRIERAGLTWEAYLEQQGKTPEQMRADYHTEAERLVKTTLLLEEIAKREKIEATPGDVEAEVASLARQYGQSREAILQMLRPNLHSVVDGIVRSKTLDFLLRNAQVAGTPPEATPSAPA
jgi:trigger factor